MGDRGGRRLLHYGRPGQGHRRGGGRRRVAAEVKIRGDEMRRKTTNVNKTRRGTKTGSKPRRSMPKTSGGAVPATEATTGQSVIGQKYRERYEDGSCGDRLARKLRKHL